MTSLIVMGAGVMVEAAGLLGWRHWYASLLVGAGGIIVGIARPGPLGAACIALGVFSIAGWWNRRRRDRARRAEVHASSAVRPLRRACAPPVLP